MKEIKPIKGGLARSLLYFLTGEDKYLENKKPRRKNLPKDKKGSIIK